MNFFDRQKFSKGKIGFDVFPNPTTNHKAVFL